MKIANLIWVVWLAYFIVFEFQALLTRHYERTFSDFVWRLFKVGPVESWRQMNFGQFFLLAFLAWLMLHLTFRVLR